MRCVEESGANRPVMGDVVKEIENIIQIAGLNPNACKVEFYQPSYWLYSVPNLLVF